MYWNHWLCRFLSFNNNLGDLYIWIMISTYVSIFLISYFKIRNKWDSWGIYILFLVILNTMYIFIYWEYVRAPKDYMLLWNDFCHVMLKHMFSHKKHRMCSNYQFKINWRTYVLSLCNINLQKKTKMYDLQVG